MSPSEQSKKSEQRKLSVSTATKPQTQQQPTQQKQKRQKTVSHQPTKTLSNQIQHPNQPTKMKHTNIAAALVAALTVGTSFAAGITTNPVIGNQINIAGSTAFSAVSMPAIDTYATGAGYTKVAADSGTVASAKIALYAKVTPVTNGTKVTITTDVINVHMIGSEGGTLVASSKNTQPFLPAVAYTTLPAYGTIAADSGTAPSAATTMQANATITFSDVNQAVGRFNTSKASPVKCIAFPYDEKLGAINFAWVAPTNFPVSNITDRVAQALLQNGHVPLSMFTGNSADATKGVFVTGRDIDSGTRVLTLTEVGLGATASVKQYTYDSANNRIVYTAGGTLDGVAYTAGNGGYFSGGDLCTAVGKAGASWTGNSPTIVDGGNSNAALSNAYSGACYLIGYGGTKDIIGKGLTAGQYTKALSYNGVQAFAGSYTFPGTQKDVNGIATGSYSMWSVGHLYANPANAPKGTDKTLVTTVANALKTAVLAKTTAELDYGYTALGDLNVSRSQEGATIFKK